MRPLKAYVKYAVDKLKSGRKKCKLALQKLLRKCQPNDNVVPLEPRGIIISSPTEFRREGITLANHVENNEMLVDQARMDAQDLFVNRTRKMQAETKAKAEDGVGAGAGGSFKKNMRKVSVGLGL